MDAPINVKNYQEKLDRHSSGTSVELKEDIGASLDESAVHFTRTKMPIAPTSSLANYTTQAPTSHKISAQ